MFFFSSLYGFLRTLRGLTSIPTDSGLWLALCALAVRHNVADLLSVYESWGEQIEKVGFIFRIVEPLGFGHTAQCPVLGHGTFG